MAISFKKICIWGFALSVAPLVYFGFVWQFQWYAHVKTHIHIDAPAHTVLAPKYSRTVSDIFVDNGALVAKSQPLGVIRTVIPEVYTNSVYITLEKFYEKNRNMRLRALLDGNVPSFLSVDTEYERRIVAYHTKAYKRDKRNIADIEMFYKNHIKMITMALKNDTMSDAQRIAKKQLLGDMQWHLKRTTIYYIRNILQQDKERHIFENVVLRPLSQNNVLQSPITGYVRFLQGIHRTVGIQGGKEIAHVYPANAPRVMSIVMDAHTLPAVQTSIKIRFYVGKSADLATVSGIVSKVQPNGKNSVVQITLQDAFVYVGDTVYDIPLWQDISVVIPYKKGTPFAYAKSFFTFTGFKRPPFLNTVLSYIQGK